MFSHLEAQFGHDLRVCLLDPPDLGGGDRAVDVLHTGRLLPAQADHLLQASLPPVPLTEAGHGLPVNQWSDTNHATLLSLPQFMFPVHASHAAQTRGGMLGIWAGRSASWRREISLERENGIVNGSKR